MNQTGRDRRSDAAPHDVDLDLTHVSPVPDLLYPHICHARIADIRDALEDPERVTAATRLHRLTVFVTYACQLACGYCKTILRTDHDRERWPHKTLSHDRRTFARLLDGLEHPVEHLHFTGGEPTIVSDLPHMVLQARNYGIPHISATSNGVIAWRRLEPLLASGLSELRVSIDARDALMAEQMSGRTRVWTHAVGNLAQLAARRRRDRSFVLIANVVISMTNRYDTEGIVRFLMDLGVDDVKLIASVEDTPTLGQFDEAGAHLASIAQALDSSARGRFPLLRRKLRTVFSERAVGLAGIDRTRGRDWRCYVPLTERTVDAAYYYPCSVYLREGGTPLGSLTDSAAVQRERTAEFVRHGNCLDDPICQRYCLRCTADFNAAANDARLPSPLPADAADLPDLSTNDVTAT